MTPKDKVTSLETSRRLKEVGFPQDTERWWKRFISDDPLEDKDDGGFSWDICNSGEFSAPDAMEIGELLPETYVNDGENVWLFSIKCTRKGFWVGYYQKGTDPSTAKGFVVCWSKNEAEARAEVWLRLKEQGII